MGLNHVSLDDLAVPFSAEIVAHLKAHPKQGTSGSSKFLEACKSHIDGTLKLESLHEETVKLGFVNVVDAFHNVQGETIRNPFYKKDYSSVGRRLVLTDELFRLTESAQFNNLMPEAEARWSLVETAWNLDINPRLIQIQHDAQHGLLFVHSFGQQRIDVSSARDALNGYQKGKCFYTFRDISVRSVDENFCDVDHFFPHVNKQRHLEQGGADINGVWNLVLSDSKVNRHEKRAKLPAIKYLERLHNRNEFYVNSKHPLCETIQNQTGSSEPRRRAFLQRQFDIAMSCASPIWTAEDELPGTF
jgi:hypothetical protein